MSRAGGPPTFRRIESWPAADREAWAAILRPGDPLLGESGAAAHWAPATQDLHRIGYGRWLGFLAASGRLDPATAPAARVTPETVRDYLASLAGLADYTVIGRLAYLLQVVAAMAPERDWRWLRQVVARLHRRSPRGRDKHPRLRASAELFQAGLALMAAAEQSAARDPLAPAVLYRNGLILALLAARPLRRRNLAMIELDRHLVRTEGGWLLVFAAEETKNRIREAMIRSVSRMRKQKPNRIKLKMK